MHKHLLAAFVATGALLVAMAPAAFAAPAPPSAAKPSIASGTPTVDDSRPMGYFVWRNDDGFHLRTHGPGAEHVFNARLHTGGTFENVQPVRLEGDDHIDILDGGHTLVLRFHTFDGIDGVNFNIREGTGERLRLDLKVDDERIATSHIFLGGKGRHPKHNPFSFSL